MLGTAAHRKRTMVLVLLGSVALFLVGFTYGYSAPAFEPAYGPAYGN